MIFYSQYSINYWAHDFQLELFHQGKSGGNKGKYIDQKSLLQPWSRHAPKKNKQQATRRAVRDIKNANSFNKQNKTKDMRIKEGQIYLLSISFSQFPIKWKLQ